MRKLIVSGALLLATLFFVAPALAEGDPYVGRPSIGPDDAPVQIAEFFDFQCAHCAKLAPVLHEVVKDYGNLVRVVAVPINTPGHAYSEPAAELALTAGEHDKFWEAYFLIFQHQDKLGDEFFMEVAKELNLDRNEVKANLANQKHRQILRENFMLAVRDLELEATPTIFLEGKKIEGVKSLDYYRYYINEALKKKNIASPVPDVSKPTADGLAGANRVPLDLIYPMPKLPPVDSELKVKVGDAAPDFELPTIMAGVKVKLSHYRGDKNVLLSFVPAAWTPTCSAQWPEYDEYQKQFGELDTVVIGISADNLPSLYSWTVSMGRPWFPVASDFWPHGEAADVYGVLRSDGTTERAVIIIDKQGVIRYIDVHDINSRPGIKTALSELKKLH